MIKTITRGLLYLVVSSALLGAPIARADDGSGLGDRQPKVVLQANCAIDPALVYGDIEAFYRVHGGSSGGFGCPTSDEYDYAGGRARTFAHGQIVWIPFPDHPPLTMGAYQEQGPTIRFEWWDSADRDFYQVQYRQDTNPTIAIDTDDRYQVIGNVYWPNSTFRIKLNGCERRGLFGIGGSHCYGWLPEVVIVTRPDTPTPPPPPQPKRPCIDEPAFNCPPGTPYGNQAPWPPQPPSWPQPPRWP